MALEKLKEAHEELENVNLPLMAQQGSEANHKTDSPCLTCLERSKTDSKGKAPIFIDDTNSSDEENLAVTEELLRLKNLFETGMFKSVQGHQYLCDILRKALLHSNPRNEGVGFERKINPDGTYWEPEQYPKNVWVLAKEKPIDIANLSGFSCKIDKAIVDESLDSDYKLIKDQEGKVSAEFVGTPPKNGFYKRQIWVRKSLVEKLPLTILCRENPRYHRITTILSRIEMNPWCLLQMFPRRNTIVSIEMFIVIIIITPKLLLPIITLTPRRGTTFMVCLMVLIDSVIMLDIILLPHLALPCLLSHLLVCGWLRRTNSSAGLCLRWIRMGHG